MRNASGTLLIALGIGLWLPGGAGAQEPAKEKAFEQNLEVGLKTVINEGAALYNNQSDWAGCYRLYEGALKAVKPLLGKYPELQKTIESSLAEANFVPRMMDRAHVLHKALQETRYTLNPSLRPKVPGKMPGDSPADKKSDAENKTKDDKKGDDKTKEEKKGEPIGDPKLAVVKLDLRLDGIPPRGVRDENHVDSVLQSKDPRRS